MRTCPAVALVGLALLAGAGDAAAAGTVRVTEGFALVEADTSVHCPPQENAPVDDNHVLQVNAVTDFEAEVEASAEGEDCGVHAAADARQLTRVSAGDGGGGLLITSSGFAGGSAGGESNEDDDFESESFRGRARVSFGFEVVGEPVEFSFHGTHSGLRQAGSFSQGVVGDPRPGFPNLDPGFALTGILQPGTYSARGEAICTHVPSGTTACPQARYSFTLVVGDEAADADGDALPDPWEEDGVDADGDGTVELDLPALGADPLHKDLFLEVDHMQGHALLQSAVDTVTQAFAQAPVANPDGTTGIALHVDNGPASTMDPRTGQAWGARSDRDELPHVDVLGEYVGGDYDWGEFDALKAANFGPEREPVFHYAISGHGYGSPTEFSSGISRGIEASDLLVTLGSGCGATGADCTFTQPEQAGTLMHEFGHNLGLRHGGGDDDNYKPNYLSIMNYAFQFGGLRSSVDPPRFDYSRFVIPLDERTLNETTGFGVAPGSPATRHFTVGFCPGPSRFVQARSPNIGWNLSGQADFDCDSAFGSVAADVNADGATTVLAPFEDWGNLVYDGGLVGLGSAALPERTVSDEGPASELIAARDALATLAPVAPSATPTPTPSTPAPGPGPSTGSGLRPLPRLSGLRVRPRAFRATRRARRGAVVSYRLSEVGRIRFRVERVLPGRRRARRCVAPRKAPRGRRCERRAAVRGSFRRTAPAGRSSFRFGGRIGGRALKPGRYVLVATPLAADGRAGTPRRARFRIAR